MKFVILTDTHFVPAERTLFGIDPAQRLAAALDTIARDHRDIAFIMITGDLAHWGQREAYAHLREVLTRAHVPVRLMMGNHDRRAAFREIFVEAEDDGEGFVQSLLITSEATLISLDTLDEDEPSHAGILCRRRLAFLQDALKAAPGNRPLLLFQHHPPFDTGLPHMDRLKLRNGVEELALMTQIRKPDYLFMGHIHRPIAGVWHGIPFHIQRGLAHQVAFDLTTSDRIPGSLELPDYALVEVREGDIVVHQRSFLYNGPTFWLDDKLAQDR